MATNTYTYGSLGERWTVGDPTSKDRLDVARTKADANRWTLTQLLDDADDSPFALANGTLATTQGASDNTTKIATTAYVTTAVAASTTSPGGSTTEIQYNNGGAFGGSANLAWTNGTSTLAVAGTANAKMLNISASGAALGSQNAFKIILADLNDPATMWDVQAFLARARFTSWYQELGAPPMRGAMWINNAKTSLVWWNLDTDAAYMQFDVGGSNNDDNNMIYLASNLPSCIAFLDGKIYFGCTGGGAWFIDLLQDECIGWFASGQRRYEGNIEERNDGKGNISTRTSVQIKNSTVSGIAAARDTTLSDEFDRPVQWWSAGTSQGASIYNPRNDAIYDWHDSNRESTRQFLMNDKWMFMRNQTTYQGVNYIQMSSVDADNVPVIHHFHPWNSADGSNRYASSFPWDKSAVISGIAGNSDASQVYIASTQGLCRITFPTDDYMYGWIWTTSAYQTPFMKGSRGGAYPLNDLNDRSGALLNLTNTGSTPQATGPLGANTAYDFDGSGMMLETASNAAQVGTNKLTVSCWFNPDAASGEEALVAKHSSTNAFNEQDWMLTVFGADMRFAVYSGNTAYIATGVALATGQWYHAAGVYDGEYVRLYLNGVEATTKAALTANMDTDSVKMTIGAEADNNHNYNGKISQVSIQTSAWTENEVKLEYQRMVRALGGAVGTLANTNVMSVQVDPDTGLAAVTTAANQTEIWDIETGLRQSIDATTTATIVDADVALKTGATLPEYITGRSGAIEFDGQTRSAI